MGQVARVLTVIPDILAENLGPHAVNGLGGEKSKRLGDCDRGYAGILGKSKILHGVDFCWWLILKVLLSIEVPRSYFISWDRVDDWFPVGSHGSDGYRDA